MRGYVLSLVMVASLTAQTGAAEQTTFTKDVAPILMSHCVECHRPGEIAPMSLLSYEQARPWAKSIRKAVLNRDMPPWDADPAIGKFSNDISLDQCDIDTIVRWIDEGAAEGDPADMPQAPNFVEGWRLGEPDLIVDLPKIDVPAAGEDVFPTIYMELPLTEKRPLQAIELQPGDRRALHHIVVFKGVIEMSDTIIDLRPADNRQPPMTDSPDVVYVYAAGSPPGEYPEGMGHTFAARQVLTFNTHYHPYGTATQDATRVGLYFAKAPHKRELMTGVAVNPSLLVPALAEAHQERGYFTFAKDSQIVSFLPHMHLRGSGMDYILHEPGGDVRTILSVPNYDYNWQWIYTLAKPIDVPAGSILEVVGTWNNSASNPNNPNPDVDVNFGEGTDDEMLVGFVDFVTQDTQTNKAVSSMSQIEGMLSRHAEGQNFTATLGILPFGLNLRDSGEGMFYLTVGNVMVASNIRDMSWDGRKLALNTRMLTPNADSMPLAITGEVDESGAFSGAFLFGQEIDTHNPPVIDNARGPSFAGKRLQ